MQNSENQESFAEFESLNDCSSIVSSRSEIDDSILSGAVNFLSSIKLESAVEQIANIEKYVKHFKTASQDWLDSYRRNSNQESAISERSLKKYIELEYHISSIYSNWGYQLSTLHLYEEAITKYEEGETIIGKLRNICKFGSKNRMHNCYQEVNKGSRINNQLSGIYSNWGFALSRLGRFEDAEDRCQRAINENGRNGLAYMRLGYARSRLRKDKEALQSYEKALKYCQDSSKINIYIGFSRTMLGQFAEASKIYKSIINDEFQKISNKCSAYYEWANTLDEEGNSKSAMEKLNEAIKLQKSSNEPSDPRLLNFLGLLHYHKKEYEKAQELFDKIINDDPSYGFAYINQRLVHNQIYHIKSKNGLLFFEKEKHSADHFSFNEANSFVVKEVSSNMSYQPDNDKIEIEKVENQLMRYKDDIETYERTVTEIRNILNILKYLKTNKVNEWDGQKDKYESYQEGISIVQKFPYLLHDYIDIYEREAKKIEKRLRRFRKEEADLKAKAHKMKTDSSKLKNVDQSYDFNKSLLANNIEMQDNPPGFE